MDHVWLLWQMYSGGENLIGVYATAQGAMLGGVWPQKPPTDAWRGKGQHQWTLSNWKGFDWLVERQEIRP